MVALLGLRKGEGRSETDAFLDMELEGQSYVIPIELKSTTTSSVSTARDVGAAHIEKWRQRVWIFGFYERKGESLKLKRVLVLSPKEMESWIAGVESYIAPDMMIGQLAAKRLTLRDMEKICGKKEVYLLEDAQRLYKRQWTIQQYREEMDLSKGYSPSKMLEILRKRAFYLNSRGATLNNPHIPKEFFAAFQSERFDVFEKTGEEIRGWFLKKMTSLLVDAPAIWQKRAESL